MGPVANPPNRNAPSSAKSTCFPLRVCLRKGCGCVYRPVRGNQRYCQDPYCLREVRRWQAGKRQRKARGHAKGRNKHASAERRRRWEKKACRKVGRADARSRGASEIAKPLAEICDRPGCYDAPRSPCARYCCLACRDTMRRVRDRERKWLKR
jgi:hypothetical protein